MMERRKKTDAKREYEKQGGSTSRWMESDRERESKKTNNVEIKVCARKTSEKKAVKQTDRLRSVLMCVLCMH